MQRCVAGLYTPSTTATTPGYGSLHRQRSLSQGAEQQEQRQAQQVAEPKEKKKLWRLYAQRECYAALLFKRGKYNKSFKKRWLVLCQGKGKQQQQQNRFQSSSKSVVEREQKHEHPKAARYSVMGMGSPRSTPRSKKKRKPAAGYLFYFDERPVKDSDFPSVWCACVGVC